MTGLLFLGSEQNIFINVALDEPSTALSIHSEEKPRIIKSSAGRTFDRRDLDLRETIRSEISEDLHPTFIKKRREPSALLPSALFKNNRALMYVYMNPGCSLDLRDATSWNPEMRSTEAGTFIVGDHPKDTSYVKLKMGRTRANEAPLLLSMPDSLSIENLQIRSDSGSALSIVAGKAQFEINRPSQDGQGDTVDVEIKTPRGTQHIPVVRTGR